MKEASNLPQSLEEAFDFSTPVIHDWEIESIQRAYEAKALSLRRNWHGGRRALERNISIRDIYNCVAHGKAKSKDLPPWNPEEKGVRQAGINYEGKAHDGRRIRVKVGWSHRGYTIITVHEI